MWRLRVGARLLANSVRRSSRQAATKKSTARIALVGAGAGIAVGAAYGLYTHYAVNLRGPSQHAERTVPYNLLARPPDYKPHVCVESSPGLAPPVADLRLVLYQYATCPFCCKVRAFLDARGIGYELVEVDAVLRQAISWSEYKKVPIVLAKVQDGYRQLIDSTAIVSILESVVRGGGELSELLQYYPIRIFKDDNGRDTTDVFNKYYIMHHENQTPDKTERENELRERRWRQWADTTLVHLLSPNVYRTLGEAYDTFGWFADTAQWRAHFPAWEVALMVNVGAVAMWLISKRLKARHALKDDVRESLYEAAREWTAAVKATNRPFMGGDVPDLADLAVYGVLSSIEGCVAFADLRANTDIGGWYDGVRQFIRGTKGHVTIPSTHPKTTPLALPNAA